MKKVTGPHQSEVDDSDRYDTAVDADVASEESTDTSDKATMNIETPVESQRSTRNTKGILPERGREVISMTSTAEAEFRRYTEAIQCLEKQS